MKHMYREELAHLGVWFHIKHRFLCWLILNFKYTRRGYCRLGLLLAVACSLVYWSLSPDIWSIWDEPESVKIPAVYSKSQMTGRNPYSDCRLNLRDENMTILDSPVNMSERFVVSYRCKKPKYVSIQLQGTDGNPPKKILNFRRKTTSETVIPTVFFLPKGQMATLRVKFTDKKLSSFEQSLRWHYLYRLRARANGE